MMGLAPLSALRAAALPEAGRTPQAPITLVFRFDDYSAKSDTTLEKEILESFRARRVPLTVSVIPRVASGSAYDPSPQPGLPLPEEKIQLLREALDAGGVEVALHGYAHQTVRRKIGGRYVKRFGRYDSEFVGVEEADQRKKIQEGRAILEGALGIQVETFVPPWNGYDLNTLKALEESGITNFSAARRGPIDVSSRLRFLPETCALANTQRVVGAAREVPGDSPVVVVLFHHYDFVEHDPTYGNFSLPRLQALLDWVEKQGDLRVLTLGEAARSLKDLSARRFYWNRNALLWQITPPWVNLLLPWPPRGIYFGLSAARRAKGVLWTIVLVLYAGLSLAGAAASWAVSKVVLQRYPSFVVPARILGLAGLLAVLTYALWDLRFYWQGMAAAALVAGLCLGLRRPHREGFR